MPSDSDLRQPALFISHGSPMVALADDAYTRALAAFGAAHPSPGAIVVVSAHWEASSPLLATASPRPPLIYDFGGFPPKLYQLVYPCPGSPALAADVVERLGSAGIAADLDPARGIDHGVWVPLQHLYRNAQVPVVELSLPTGNAARLAAMGRALAPLRERVVMLIGSGGVVHNLGRLNWMDKDGPVEQWALAFDEWVADRVQRRDVNALARFQAEAPEAARAMPTREH